MTETPIATPKGKTKRCVNLALEERKDPGLWIGGTEGLASVGDRRSPMAGPFQ